MNPLDAAYMLAATALSPWWLRKGRSGWAERFAHGLPRLGEPGGRPRVMVHAVSVGEINAIRQLVPRLAREAEVVVSVTTDTGMARARNLFAESCRVVRYPLDGSWVVRRFLDRIRPDVVALVELELWPNFVSECRSREIPVAVVNGRLSARSARGYRRVRRWMAPAFGSLEVAAVQDEEYASRFVELGVPRSRCVITGSMKFDSASIADAVDGADELAGRLGIDRSRPLVVAGSTGPGEEAMLLGAVRARPELRDAQLLCAPRKPQRFDEAAAALPSCVRWSDGSGDPASGLYLLDTIGELHKAYSLADVVVVGRSFFDLHGSDPIEPVALGKATVIGPSVADFASIVERLSGCGGLVTTDAARLPDLLADLLGDPARREEMASSGRRCIRELQGASERHAEILLHLAQPEAAGHGAEHRGGPGAESCGLGSSAARA